MTDTHGGLVRYYVAQSLDGYIAEADHTLGWLLRHDERAAPTDEGVGAVPLEGEHERFLEGVGALVVGARTYEWVLAEVGAWDYELPTWVLSHRDLPVTDGVDVRVRAVPAPEAAREALAVAGGRDVWVVGGGPVAQDLLDAGALDTVEVTVVPVVLGAGVPLLSGRVDRPMALTGVRAYENGMVHLTYRVRSAAR